MDSKGIASISISGELTLNMQSLNNEGGEGNQIMTRQVTIFDKNGTDYTVPGISGDMFKHIHAEHLANYCQEHGILLSNYSSVLNPNRISANELALDAGKEEQGQCDVVNAAIRHCAVCDTHGFLITSKVGKNPGSSNTPRKSVIDFGWLVGIPSKSNTESYIHSKLVPDAGTIESGSGANEGQNLFHRPANYGTYAFVCNIEVYRIGLNDINRKYAIPDNERLERYKAILAALLSCFLFPKGAMISSQLPHITDFKGELAISHDLIPAPTMSALNPDYKRQLEKISEAINGIENDAIEIRHFDDLANFSNEIKELEEETPYRIR